MKKLLSALLALLLSFGALAEHMGAPYEFRNSSVTNARIASGVTEIAEGAYYYCKELQTLEVPSTVTKIGDYAFDHCENLTELTVPNSVREIGECAFNYCMRIANLDLGNGVKTLGNYAFSCCFSLRQATIPQSVTRIGDYAFYNCRTLDTLYIYSSVQTIGVSALEGCPRLTVYTPAASPAAAYCTQNGIKWVAIEEPEKTEDFDDLPASEEEAANSYEAFVQGGEAQSYLTRILEIEKDSIYRITRDQVLDDFSDGGFDLWVKSIYKGLTSDGVVKELADIAKDQELDLMKSFIMELLNSGAKAEDSVLSDLINSIFDLTSYHIDPEDFSKIDFSLKGNSSVSYVSYGFTALSTVIDCVNVGKASYAQKQALMQSILEYDAHMRSLTQIINASSGTLQTAAKLVRSDVENAYIGNLKSIKQDATTGLLLTGANSVVNVFDFPSWLRGLFRLTTNQTSKTVAAEFAFLEYATTLAQIKEACISAISKKDTATYDLLQLYCIGLLKGFDNTYTYYSSYGKTWSGRLATAFGGYDKDELLSNIDKQKETLDTLRREMADALS